MGIQRDDRHCHTNSANHTWSTSLPSRDVLIFWKTYGSPCHKNQVPTSCKETQYAKRDRKSNGNIGSFLNYGWMSSLVSPYSLLERENRMQYGICNRSDRLEVLVLCWGKFPRLLTEVNVRMTVGILVLSPGSAPMR